MKVFENFLTFGNYTSCWHLKANALYRWPYFGFAFLSFEHFLLFNIPTYIYMILFKSVRFINQEDKCILL